MEEKVNQKISLILSFIAGYLYMNVFFFNNGTDVTIQFLAFAIILTGWVIVINKQRVKESWIWLITFWMNIIAFAYLISPLVGRYSFARVWSDSLILFLFIHCYCIYWILSISNGLVKTESSNYFIVDCFSGAILIPFSHLCDWLMDLIQILKEGKKEKKSITQYLYIVIAIIISIFLFTTAVSLLSVVNEQFAQIFKGFLDLMSLKNFNIDFISETTVKAFFSLPVTFYLYGLITGIKKDQPDRKKDTISFVETFLEFIRKVPVQFWNVVLGIFNVLYIVFIILQFNYLFYIILCGNSLDIYEVSYYARNGFFELCSVMTINFSLLWICHKTSKEENISKVLSIGLMVESIFLAITAFSKIYFYITKFGFTPLRIQSIWFTTVLMVGCLCVIYSLIKKKDSSRLWIFFTGISLAITILI